MKKILILILTLSFVNLSFAEEFFLDPKPGIYDKPIKVSIKSSDKILKTFWTENINSFLDETFEYEKKINISHSTKLYYFGLLGNYNSTRYFSSEYFIKLNPGKFGYNLKLSKIYPKKDLIEIKNEGKFEVSTFNWKISTLNDEKSFGFFRLKPGEKKLIKIKVGDFLDIIRLKDPLFITKNKFIYNETEVLKDFYFEKIPGINIFHQIFY